MSVEAALVATGFTVKGTSTIDYARVRSELPQIFTRAHILPISTDGKICPSCSELKYIGFTFCSTRYKKSTTKTPAVYDAYNICNACKYCWDRFGKKVV